MTVFKKGAIIWRVTCNSPFIFMELGLFRIMQTGSMTSEVIISQDGSSETKIKYKIEKIMKVKIQN
jgi:hypothetical protein